MFSAIRVWLESLRLSLEIAPTETGPVSLGETTAVGKGEAPVARDEGSSSSSSTEEEGSRFVLFTTLYSIAAAISNGPYYYCYFQVRDNNNNNNIIVRTLFVSGSAQ